MIPRQQFAKNWNTDAGHFILIFLFLAIATTTDVLTRCWVFTRRITVVYDYGQRIVS